MLSTLLSSEMSVSKKKENLETKYGLPMTVLMERECNDMCNLSQGIYEEGIEKGIEKGKLNLLCELIVEGTYTIKAAAKKFSMSEDEFSKIYDDWKEKQKKVSNE